MPERPYRPQLQSPPRPKLSPLPPSSLHPPPRTHQRLVLRRFFPLPLPLSRRPLPKAPLPLLRL